MDQQNRRQFFADVGKGMMTAAMGSALAGELGVGLAEADGAPERLTFGVLEPLVALMQETPPGRLLPQVVQRLRNGTELRQVVAAAALANARTFGGEDYVGFHTLMAMGPSYHMAQSMPEARRALPILKVLYRNSNRITERGRNPEVLQAVRAEANPAARPSAEQLRAQVRQRNITAAERTFAALAATSAEDAFNNLIITVADATEVHRVVLPYRAWDLVGIIGRDRAHTLLRQSVRFCVQAEQPRYVEAFRPSRETLARALETHRLLGRQLGNRRAEDAWVERLSQTIFRSTPAQAADAAAGALAEGMDPAAIGEAITLAANQLVLRDQGRPQNQTAPNRGLGSCHGDSIGVHGSDSANAWRNIARVGNARTTMIGLILGAYQVASDRSNRGGNFLEWQPYPHAQALERVTSREPEALLREAEEAIRARDQMRASAIVHRYGELGHPHRPVFDLLLRYAISEDGALHAEKFYQTVSEEYRSTRQAFRWRHVVGLARVTASACGQPAPGYADACRLLEA